MLFDQLECLTYKEKYKTIFFNSIRDYDVPLMDNL